MLPLDLCLDQRAPRSRLRGNDRQLQARVVEKPPPEAEHVLAPDFNLRQALADAVALDRIVVDEQKAIERKAQLLGDRADIADLVVPVDAPRHEIVGCQQPMPWVMIGVFPELANAGFVIFADAGQHNAALLETKQRFVQTAIEPDK